MGSRTILVTGTDTGVGKTIVTAALTRSLRALGQRVIAIKPLESGCEPAPTASEDGVVLARAAGQEAPRHALHRYRDPIAPAEAAEREGAPVDLEPLARWIVTLGQAADVTLVEGAGGLLSPLSWSWGHLELVAALDATLLLVAGDKLGTVNHTLLTLAEIRRRRRPVLGLVLSAPAEPDASTGQNAAAIARAEPGIRIARLGRIAPSDLETARLDRVAEWVVE
jgi:dethiobiotin synthetase